MQRASRAGIASVLVALALGCAPRTQSGVHEPTGSAPSASSRARADGSLDEVADESAPPFESASEASVAVAADAQVASAQEPSGNQEIGASAEHEGASVVQTETARADEARPLEASAAAALPYALFEIPGNELRLPIPRAEELVFRVHIGLGPAEAEVGKLTLSTLVEPYRDSVLGRAPASSAPAASAPAPREVVLLRARAKGGYAFYEADTLIQSRILPQEWPRVLYTSTQSGTEERRSELSLGTLEGKPSARFKKDTDKGAPRGTRLWREPKMREIPEGTLDMLSATFLARAMLEAGRPHVDLAMIDKLKVWQVRLKRGKTSIEKVPAGRFEVIELIMETKPHASEPPPEKGEERFEGPFGINGDIRIWLHARTGVPVRFKGEIPAGLFTLHADMALISHKGAPAAFQPAPEPPAPSKTSAKK